MSSQQPSVDRRKGGAGSRKGCGALGASAVVRPPTALSPPAKLRLLFLLHTMTPPVSHPRGVGRLAGDWVIVWGWLVGWSVLR